LSDFSKEDIRAAVAAGVLNEQQAVGLLTLAQERLGIRDHLMDEDEPFEFFKGFSEIFVTVGLWLLLSGVIGLGAVLNGGVGIGVLGMVLTWIFALYFTKKRRMNLPSMSLAAGFGVFLAGTVLSIFAMGDELTGYHVIIMAGVGMVGMLIYYRAFKLPFTMFVFGIFGLIMVYAIMGMQGAKFSIFDFPDGLFDLGNNSGFAIGSLIFGFAAFALGIWFDTKDPHRISRYSATGFWLHILAAPAIVNTIALTLVNSGGTQGYLLTALLLFVVTILSLVIDRRSFLTAGIGYFALLIPWMTPQYASGETGMVFTLLILGALITALGTWWVQIRSWLMRLLPDFPFKDRFPPYIRGQND